VEQADSAGTAAAADLSGDAFATALGVEIVTATGDEVVARLPLAPHLHQPYGIVHGGAYCTAVEVAATHGAAAWLGDRGQVVGISNRTDFLRATREGVLDVRAAPVHRGRTQQLWAVQITDGTGRLVAQGQVRLANVPA
jgi:1,4-dihydroxy-2-naphthoyl-CoA hydrolase